MARVVSVKYLWRLHSICLIAFVADTMKTATSCASATEVIVVTLLQYRNVFKIYLWLDKNLLYLCLPYWQWHS